MSNMPQSPPAGDELEKLLFDFSWDTHLVKLETRARKLSDEQAVEKYQQLYGKATAQLNAYILAQIEALIAPITEHQPLTYERIMAAAHARFGAEEGKQE